jgi:hypothetical protein
LAQAPSADRATNRDFQAYMSGREGRALSQAERDALFRDFLQWRQRRQ